MTFATSTFCPRFLGNFRTIYKFSSHPPPVSISTDTDNIRNFGPVRVGFGPLGVEFGPLEVDVGHLRVIFGPLEVDFKLDGGFMLLGFDFRALGVGHEPRGVDIWSLRVNLGPLGVDFGPLRSQIWASGS